MPRDEGWTKVMERFHYTCVFPYCWLGADIVHEEPPRSLQPEMQDEDRYPLCNPHHEEVHSMSRDVAKATLERGAKLVLAFYSS